MSSEAITLPFVNALIIGHILGKTTPRWREFPNFNYLWIILINNSQ